MLSVFPAQRDLDLARRTSIDANWLRVFLFPVRRPHLQVLVLAHGHQALPKPAQPCYYVIVRRFELAELLKRLQTESVDLSVSAPVVDHLVLPSHAEHVLRFLGHVQQTESKIESPPRLDIEDVASGTVEERLPVQVKLAAEDLGPPELLQVAPDRARGPAFTHVPDLHDLIVFGCGVEDVRSWLLYHYSVGCLPRIRPLFEP